jgi:hypothetical protein
VTPEDLEAYRRACIRIEPLTIQEEYVRVPADLAFWSEQHSVVFRAWQIAKFEREQEWGRAVARARTELLSERQGAAGRGPTVDQVEALAVNDPTYVQMKQDEIHLEAERQRLLGMIQSIQAKRDMVNER